MQVEIILFGQLTDITGSNIITLEAVPDTDTLVKAINKLFPAMNGIKYIIAVDKIRAAGNTIINEGSSVALLPPFSGG